MWHCAHCETAGAGGSVSVTELSSDRDGTQKHARPRHTGSMATISSASGIAGCFCSVRKTQLHAIAPEYGFDRQFVSWPHGKRSSNFDLIDFKCPLPLVE